MNVDMAIRNESARKRLYTAADLRELAQTICASEGLTADVELSILMCDDHFIQDLNRQFRKKDESTDVLSFSADPAASSAAGHAVLGDIVISLETVENRCPGDRNAMRQEVRLLFCHGLLHLLGHTHGNAAERRAMAAKQALYLGLSPEDAWPEEISTRRNQGRH